MILKVEKIGYCIGDKKILDDISFTISEGEIISIIGSNGAGKSTLLKLMLNLINGSSGDIILYNRSVKDYKRLDLAKVVSYLSQTNHNFMNLTVEDIVYSGRYPYLSSLSSLKRLDIEIAEKMMCLTGVIDMRHRNIATLSGGERQRVFIASSLTQEAKLLLLDEPTVYLDPKSNQDIFDLLKKLNKEEQVTMVIVSHDINNLLLLNSRFIALKDGKMLFNRSISDIDINDLNSTYGYDFNHIYHPKMKDNIQLLP